jgi:hypothetical protein
MVQDLLLTSSARRQIGMNGNIIANAGFVEQFATRTDSKGAKVLAPGILSAWGGAMTVGQTCGFLFFPP